MSQENVDVFEEPEVLDDFELDGDGVSEEDLNSGGGLVNKAGRYHFEVRMVKADLDTHDSKGNERSPSVRLDLVVLHSVEGQSPEGARLFHRLYVKGKGGDPASEGARNGVLKFCTALGVAKEIKSGDKSKIVDSETGGPINLATLNRAVGNQLIAEVDWEEPEPPYKGKWRIPYNNVWHPMNPAVADVPKSHEYLALAGYKVDDQPADAIDDPDL